MWSYERRKHTDKFKTLVFLHENPRIRYSEIVRWMHRDKDGNPSTLPWDVLRGGDSIAFGRNGFIYKMTDPVYNVKGKIIGYNLNQKGLDYINPDL